MREKFELRAIMEPAALRMAAPHLHYSQIEEFRDRIGVDPSLKPEDLEDALMKHCIAQAPNTSLVEMIQNNQMLLTSVNRALTGLGLPEDEIALDQYRTLFDLIARHPIDSAAEYLRDHLRIMGSKNLARMKIVAVISETVGFAPYLSPH
jgi:DNA-binding GntR family transcriptional regulator